MFLLKYSIDYYSLRIRTLIVKNTSLSLHDLMLGFDYLKMNLQFNCTIFYK